MPRVALFEDSRADQLRPLTLTRPVFELLSAPISAVEMVVGYVGAAATKSIVLGLIILLTARFFVPYEIQHPLLMAFFLILTAFTLMGLAFLLTGGFDRNVQTKRMLGAVTVVIILQAAALGVMSLASKNLGYVGAMYAVALLPIPLGLYILLAPPWGFGRPPLHTRTA